MAMVNLVTTPTSTRAFASFDDAFVAFTTTDEEAELRFISDTTLERCYPGVEVEA
jgi:hypothetical protein